MPTRGVTTVRRPDRSTFWARNASTPIALATGPLTSADEVSSTLPLGSALYPSLPRGQGALSGRAPSW